jgi:recombination protein RecA
MAFASNETTTGGNALKFYASIRLDVRRIATLKKDDKPIGNRVVVKVVKNKVAPPFRKVEVDLLFGEGISKEFELLDAALQYGLVQQAGAWFAVDGEKLAQGRDNCVKKFKAEPALFNKLLIAVQKKMSEAAPVIPVVPASDDNEDDSE